jgi:hypothetical protein
MGGSRYHGKGEGRAVILMAGSKIKLETIAPLHMGDLFDGSPAAPARNGAKAVKRAKVIQPAIQPVEEAPAVAPPKHYATIDCPCCKRRVGAPNLEIIIDHYGPLQEAILRAVWRGKGMPVQNRADLLDDVCGRSGRRARAFQNVSRFQGRALPSARPPQGFRRPDRDGR